MQEINDNSISDLKMDAAVDFAVTTITPFTIEPNQETEISVHGIELDKVCSVAAHGLGKCELIQNKSNSSLLTVSVTAPPDTMFFILLLGEEDSWMPVGPICSLPLETKSESV